MLRLLYTLTYFLSVIPLKVYDIRQGTEYSRGKNETGDKDGRYEYYPSSVFSFPFLRRYIRRHMNGGAGHGILDIGCGKGLALIFFAGLNFERVAGIEYDEELCELAQKNLRKAPMNIDVYHMDAADFTSYGDYDTFYLYNPFDGEILDKCMDRILRSVKSRPRDLTVFYCNPVRGDLLKAKGFEKTAHLYYKTDVFIFRGERRR